MNIASSGSGSGSVCDLAGGCAGWMGDTGSLILSIVVTLILVGALFYYVKQRVEILETSQKEQIHIMQSFIASIGDQFHRMNVYIQHKLGSTNEVTTNEDSKQQQQQQQQQQQHTRMGSSRIDISDHEMIRMIPRSYICDLNLNPNQTRTRDLIRIRIQVRMEEKVMTARAVTLLEIHG